MSLCVCQNVSGSSTHPAAAPAHRSGLLRTPRAVSVPVRSRDEAWRHPAAIIHPAAPTSVVVGRRLVGTGVDTLDSRLPRRFLGEV